MLYLIQDNQKVLVNKNVQVNKNTSIEQCSNVERSFASDITVTDKYIIKHNGFNIAYAKCRITGKSNLRLRSDFSPLVKHILAKNELMFSSIERYKTMLVLLLCVSANILGFSFLAFN